MKLKEFIDSFEDQDKMIYIGTGNAWQFIGTKAEYDRYFAEVTERFHGNLKETYEKRREKIKQLMDSVPKPCGDASNYAKKLINIGMQILDMKVSVTNAKMALNMFIPFEERDIIETFEKDPLMPGIGVVLKGKETGKFWLRKEFEAWMRGEGFPKLTEDNDEEEEGEE